MVFAAGADKMLFKLGVVSFGTPLGCVNYKNCRWRGGKRLGRLMGAGGG